MLDRIDSIVWGYNNIYAWKVCPMKAVITYVSYTSTWTSPKAQIPLGEGEGQVKPLQPPSCDP